jgi:parvulin-like peptidyl-prolyl isomerase
MSNEGVKATVLNKSFKLISVAILAIAAISFTACESGGAKTNPDETVTPDVAATVNGKAIKMEEVERLLRSPGGGQEVKASPLELAQARLSILQQLIQQEVMFQKAEAEKTVPTDEEVLQKYNEAKTKSGLSADAIEKQMKEIGETEESAKDKIKKQLAVEKLIEKITGKIEPPKDAEIEAFYNGNKEAFVKKRGVKLAAIVIDPKDNGEGDTTKDEQSAVLKGNEIIKKLSAGEDFAKLARENSEDQSAVQGGDIGYVSEEEMKQQFPPQVLQFMNPQFPVGRFVAVPMQGKFYILKLQERNDKDENLTLESPGVRQQITENLTNARKSILSASYAAIVMSEAKIVNNLAQRVLDNPNALSGARPAGANDSNANTNANTNANANSNANANAKPADKKEANANAKPVANANANAKPAEAPKAANTTANAEANKPAANAGK